jgi:phage terminase large subunit-like protein
VQQYIDGVLAGCIPAGELVRLAVQRHVDDLEHGHERGLVFSPEKAEEAIEFFSYLKHSKGKWAGQPFRLEPWQTFMLWVLFGWLRADGTRRFRTAYVELPRKNGKSSMGAGIGLKLAFADGELGAEVYSAATKKDQAIIVHGEATRMVRATPELSATIKIYKNNLSREDTYQKYEPLGADEDTLDGLNVHGAVIDELHAHKTRGVLDIIETGTSARQQPLLFIITTAGTDQSETSVCWEQHVYGEQVVRRIIDDDTFFAFISAIDEQDRWDDERAWFKANPNLGVSKSLDYMREQARKARNMPAKLNSFLRLELNRWVQQVTRWIDMQLWDENAGPPIDEAALHGRLCYGGLDLSSVSDLTAWVLLFPDPVVTDRLTILPRLWCPEARLLDQGDGRNRYRDQYQAWARDGWIQTTPGNAIDYEAIKAQILRDAQTFQIAEIAVDRLFQGYQLSMQLADEGLTVAACGMGYMSMAGPTAEFERRLLQRQLHHGGHPVLRWMANNVAVREDPAGNKKPDKASSQGKIDGIIGILLALDRAMRQQTTTSVYESRGLLTLGGTNGDTTQTAGG